MPVSTRAGHVPVSQSRGRRGQSVAALVGGRLFGLFGLLYWFLVDMSLTTAILFVVSGIRSMNPKPFRKYREVT